MSTYMYAFVKTITPLRKKNISNAYGFIFVRYHSGASSGLGRSRAGLVAKTSPAVKWELFWACELCLLIISPLLITKKAVDQRNHVNSLVFLQCCQKTSIYVAVWPMDKRNAISTLSRNDGGRQRDRGCVNTSPEKEIEEWEMSICVFCKKFFFLHSSLKYFASLF